ncbi:hypothetical protein AbraIFM66950_003458 [Aspergillus brasiliensis]|nr:hypothetical protein AbraIFM66950_003458 [Aspergillus brasiliensis]
MKPGHSNLQSNSGLENAEQWHKDLYSLVRASRHFYHSLQSFLLPHNVKYNDSSALLWAASRGRADLVQAIFRIPGANPNTGISSGESPLLAAARHGHAEVVRLLLAPQPRSSLAAYVNETARERGDTPLMVAAKAGHVEVVQLLLQDWRVDVDQGNYDGRTALAQAAISGFPAVAKLLLVTERVEPTMPDGELWSPLTFAATAGHLDVVKVLLEGEKRVDVGFGDWNGVTPLMWAVRYGVRHVVEFLLDRNDEDVALRDGAGRTARMWAEECGHQDIVELFDSRGIE